MIQFGFYIWSLTAILMLLLIIKNNNQPQKAIIRYIIICISWIAYLLIISNIGVLENFDLPPRVPLLIVIPAILCIILLSSRKSFLSTITHTPLHFPIYLQSFRIVVEILIYSAFLEGIFPQRATFEGMNYDILVGISALGIGYLVQNKRISLQGLLIWNIISLIILSITAYSFIFTYYFTDYLTTTGSKDFIKFPYLLLASVLLPTAVFLHIFSIRQIFFIKKNKVHNTTK